jgi:sodium-dependent dicarboxylate transporter 2/3/5
MEMDANAASDGFSRFDRLRAQAGFIIATALFALILMSEFEGLSWSAQCLAAIMAAVIVLWICESLPLPVTALLGAAACVLLKVAPAKEVFAPFADQLMFLFIGSFIIGRAIFLHQLDRRVAYAVLSLDWVAARPARVLFAFGAVTAFISAWISNTATTAMMFAIGLSLLKFLKENEAAGGSKIDPRYATGLMLMTSFSASIGGLATPIGTPPNVIGLGFIRSQIGADLTFFEWTLIGVPVVVVLYFFLAAYMNFLCPAGVREVAGCREMLASQRDALGPWTAGEKSTLIAFSITVALWVFPGVVAILYGEASETYKMVNSRLPEAVPAILGAALLFILPGGPGRRAMTWSEAAKIDWGVVLLYGGGFALGVLTKDTGLAKALADVLFEYIPISSELGLLVAVTLVAVAMSEMTSNTASANIVIPIVIPLATKFTGNPMPAALAATLACSLGFMLPVSTPCNAIVYGSGLIPLGRMIRYGFLLDVMGVIVIVTFVWMVGPWLG